MSWADMPVIRQGKEVSGRILEPIVDQLLEITNRIEHYAEKTSNETVTSSTTMQDDNELFLTVEPNAGYHIDTHLLYSAAGVATTSGWKIGWSAPSGATFDWQPMAKTDADAGAASATWWASRVLADTIGIAGSGASVVTARPSGMLLTSSAGGLLTFRWAQNTSNATGTVVYARSLLLARRFK